MADRPYISVEDVAMWYPYKKNEKIFSRKKEKDWIKAVDGICLGIERGEILGVIGESGCGKSTLGKILTAAGKTDKRRLLYRRCFHEENDKGGS